MEFNYKKSLGQNFIYDTNFLRAMVADLNISKNDTVVEVGAGAGTLTQVLAAQAKQVYAVEIDQRLAPILQKNLAACPNVQLLWQDALQYDFRSYVPFRLIANVPYYITTPLLLKFLTLANCLDVNVLVASEVAQRIVAPVGTAAYGALSVACQLLADCQIIKAVPRTLFTPMPKIDSAFVRLQKRNNHLAPNFSVFLKVIFAARRKTIHNALAKFLHDDKVAAATILQQCGIALNLRPEQITPTAFWQIFQKCGNFDKKV